MTQTGVSTLDILKKTWIRNSERKTPFLMKIGADAPHVLEIFEGNSLDFIHSAEEMEQQCNKLGTQCFILPYSAVRQAGGRAVADGLHPTFFTVNSQKSLGITDCDRARALQISQRSNSEVRVEPRTSDQEYGESIHFAQDTLIQSGEGCNFVFRRDYDTIFPSEIDSSEAALACFLGVFSARNVSYWNFAWFDGETFVVGSSPESVISLSDGTLRMTPISGTFRGVYDKRSFEDFLIDQKEVFELNMVLDEELKIMSKLCDSMISVEGPKLIDAGSVLHTGFLINGKLSTSIGKALLSSLGPPTVVGSPLSTAQSHVALVEKDSRGFYSGSCGIIHNRPGHETQLESALIIRCLEMEVDSHIGKIRAGATIVRDSITVEEIAEVASKAMSAAKSMGIAPTDARDIGSPQHVKCSELSKSKSVAPSGVVAEILKRRSERVPSIWKGEAGCTTQRNPSMEGKSAILIECGDDFIWMIAYILRKNGFKTSVVNWKSDLSLLRGQDCLILGPGPGDPRIDNERAEAIRMWEASARELNIATIAVCLSHQILSKAFGYSLERIPGSVSQGKQLEFQLENGSKHKFAAYNSYRVVCAGSSDPLDYIKGFGYRSFQFHPESILSDSGDEFLLREIEEAMQEIPSNPQVKRTLRITLWRVSEDELIELNNQTQMQARLWGFTRGILRKTWTTSQDKKYWGAITETVKRTSVDYSLRINVGKQITRREPDIDMNLDVLQDVTTEADHVS